MSLVPELQFPAPSLAQGCGLGRLGVPGGHTELCAVMLYSWLGSSGEGGLLHTSVCILHLGVYLLHTNPGDDGVAVLPRGCACRAGEGAELVPLPCVGAPGLPAVLARWNTAEQSLPSGREGLRAGADSFQEQ